MLKPLNDKIVFEEVEVEHSTSSGIILQGNPNGDIKRGRVLSVGSKVESVKEGDLLLVDWQFASKSKFENKTIFVIKEENVIAIVEE